MKRYVHLMTSFWLLQACISNPDMEEQKRIVQLKTILPPDNPQEPDWPSQLTLLIETQLLDIYKIVRPTVEMRDGPGLNYPLDANLLQEGDLVVKIADHGIWRKVLVLTSGEKAWVHYRTIKAYRPSKKYISMKLNHIPRVFVSGPISHAIDFSTGQKRPWSPAKGRPFPVLQKRGKLTLVYLPETNSLAWLTSRDVQ